MTCSAETGRRAPWQRPYSVVFIGPQSVLRQMVPSVIIMFVFSFLMPLTLNFPRFLVLVQIVGVSDGTADGAANVVLGASLEINQNTPDRFGILYSRGFHLSLFCVSCKLGYNCTLFILKSKPHKRAAQRLLGRKGIEKYVHCITVTFLISNKKGHL